MSLPIVQTKNAFVSLPPSVLHALMETAAGSVDAAHYFVERYKENLGRKAPPSLIAKLDEWEKLVTAGLSESNTSWDGEFVNRTLLANSLINLSEAAIQTSNIIGTENLHLDFAISNESQFLRGYSSNKDPLNEADLEAMDLSFNAWLAEQDIIIEDGVLYQMETQDKRYKVDPVKMVELIKEDSNGFIPYMHKKGIELTIDQHEYPQQPQAAPVA
jgi:PPE-repeat protein